ncbi:MAG: thiamine-binding protein [Pseudonocardia sp.]|nr:thiamine-binding protein [Pseudonocardia sp.]
MLVAFSVAPSGGGSDSVGDVVAEAVRVVRESGLPNETTSMFTTIEAETWDEAMDVVKRAVEAVQARAPRVSLVLKADIRPGWSGQLGAKVERIEAALDDRSDPSAAGPERA